MWFVGLALGAALVIHPALGSGVRATSGDTPTTFTAALFAGGSSVSIVGAGGFEPYTDTFRLFYFWAALAGTAVTSLVLTYLMQVYTGTPSPQHRRVGCRYVVWTDGRRRRAVGALVSGRPDVGGL